MAYFGDEDEDKIKERKEQEPQTLLDIFKTMLEEKEEEQKRRFAEVV